MRTAFIILLFTFCISSFAIGKKTPDDNKTDLENISKVHDGIVFLHKLKVLNLNIHKGSLIWYLFTDENNREQLPIYIDSEYPELKQEFINYSNVLNSKEKTDSIFIGIESSIILTNKIIRNLKSMEDRENANKLFAAKDLSETIAPNYYQIDNLINKMIQQEELKFENIITILKKNSTINVIDISNIHTSLITMYTTKEMIGDITYNTLNWLFRGHDKNPKLKLKNVLDNNYSLNIKKIKLIFDAQKTTASDKEKSDTLISLLNRFHFAPKEIMDLLPDKESYEDVSILFLSEDNFMSILLPQYSQMIYLLDYEIKIYGYNLKFAISDELKKN
jgi:hypothetical protein